jgi:peptidoglycan/LPS O-acetylase OafA/YrhL
VWPWHVKNETQYKGALWYIMVFASYWRMPLLFLISGAGTFFALGKRSTGQYLGERFKRLFIPLLAGIFILVPLQVYIEKSTQYDSLLDFYPHMFEGIYPAGNFSWHHLWFIAYLFVISLFISPFIKRFRSNGFKRFSLKLEKFVAIPLSLNIILIPLYFSQVLLRPYFPENTHALVNDWAAMAYYIIFFLSGIVLLSNPRISDYIRDQRHWYLAEAVLATVVMFGVTEIIQDDSIRGTVWRISSHILAWSCGLAAIGFAKKYLNRDSRFRQLANEAIYPFYLLHQPVIVVVGYYVVRWDISVWPKVLIITLASFIITVVLYWYFVRMMNFTRVIFGMKPLPGKKFVERKGELVPVTVRH